jgi:two-component system OmpR family sensor kinase
MKIFKSIKWRLQIWYGLILVGVLAGFGLTAYQLARNQQIDRIDSELHHRLGIVIIALHHPPSRRPGFEFDRPPPDRPEPFRDGEPPGPPGNDPEDRPGDRPLHIFHLPAEDAHYFDDSDPHDYYFRILDLRRRGGNPGEPTEIARSTNYPGEVRPPFYKPPAITHIPEPVFNLPPDASPPSLGPVNNAASLISSDATKPPPMKTFDHYRVTGEMLPSGDFVEVGCSITPELHELKVTAWRLAIIGGGILLLGLTGGWWLVDRALRPVAEISSAAARISGSDLAQRINVSETESELGELATVLNSTFARLEIAFDQQRQFTADAAHELRTPVTVILTQTQTTLNRERDTAAYRQALEACERAAQRMRKLIESLLALARLEAGQEALNRQRVDLAGVVTDSVALLRPLAEERGIKIVTELAPVEISGDAERLAQVATNLLANAIQYNRPDGEVRLGLKSENGLVVLTVADNGPGISAADLPRVFERFYRADASRTGSGNTGLGLAICQAIVTAHAGMIEVTSDEKVGTKFTVRMPMS